MNLRELEEPQPWMQDAACLGTDPDLFFPKQGEDTTAAKEVCRSCPVRLLCLDHAIRHHERFGVWGGLSERQRRRLHVRRKPSPRKV